MRLCARVNESERERERESSIESWVVVVLLVVMVVVVAYSVTSAVMKKWNDIVQVEWSLRQVVKEEKEVRVPTNKTTDREK